MARPCPAVPGPAWTGALKYAFLALKHHCGAFLSRAVRQLELY